MPAAIAIPAIVGAGSAAASLAGAKMASNASKNAAKTQVQAADRAQAFNERAWQAQQEALRPYQQAGQQSLGSLMQRQYGQGAMPMDQRVNSFVQSAQGGMAPSMGGGGQMAPRMANQGMSLGQMQQPVPMGGAPRPAGVPNGMVRVKAPTGEMAMLPDGSPQLQMAIAKGAEVMR